MTNPAPGLVSHSTEAAISSGVPSRLMGWLALATSRSSSPLSIMSVTIGVAIVPGQMALIRTPRGAYSRAALRVRPMTPCLVAWYAARPGSPPRPPREELLTIAPLPWLRIWASSCFMQAHTPRRLMALTRSKTSAGSSAASQGGPWMPALLNAMSSRPNASIPAFTAAATAALVGDVAHHADHLVPGGGQIVGRPLQRSLVDVGQHHGGAGLGVCLCRGQAHPGAGAGDQGDLAGEVIGHIHHQAFQIQLPPGRSAPRARR